MLKAAAKGESAKIVKYLLEKGQKSNSPDVLYPALFEAITHEHEACALQFLSHGASPNTPPGSDTGFRSGKTLLHRAIDLVGIWIAPCLLSHGAKIPKSSGRYRRRPFTALQAAIWNSFWMDAEALLDHRATIFPDRWEWRTGIIRAVQKGDTQIVEILLSKSGMGKVWDDDCLQVAVSRGDVRMVRLLQIWGRRKWTTAIGAPQKASDC